MDKIEPEDYLELTRVMDVNVSKKHGSVVWVEKKPDPLERSYTSSIKYLDQDGNIRQYTTGLKSDFHPRFSPDGSYLAFISTRGGKPQIFMMPTNGGEAIQLSSSKHEVSGFSWSPDSETIAFISNVDPNDDSEDKKPRTFYEKDILQAEKEEEKRRLEDPRVVTDITYRRGTSYDDPRLYRHIFTIDIKTKETKQISDGEYHHTTPEFVNNRELITISNREEYRDLDPVASLIKYNIDDKQEDILIKVDNAWIQKPIADKGLIFLSHFGSGSYAGQISKWSQFKNGSTEFINKELDRSIEQIRVLDEKTLLVAVSDAGITDIRLYDLEKKSYEKLFELDVSVVDFDMISEDEIYFTGTDTNHVWAIWKWTKADGLELIEDPNNELFRDRLIVEPEFFWLENPEGVKFQGWFFDAGKTEDGKLPPLVLSIHGGPHVMWSNAGTMWHEWQCTVSAGYSVLAVNPIGSDGYGEEVSQVITGKWGVDDARDLLQAVDHFIDRVDENRLYITGGSYAGFQTANIISKTNRFKAACAQRGVYEMINFGLSSDIPLFAIWEMGGDPWEKLEDYWNLFPVGRAKSIETPLLLIHAENDFRVPIAQAEELFAALKLQKKEVVLVRYPRDGHELSRSGEPFHVVDRIERMLDWFDTHP